MESTARSCLERIRTFGDAAGDQKEQQRHQFSLPKAAQHPRLDACRCRSAYTDGEPQSLRSEEGRAFARLILAISISVVLDRRENPYDPIVSALMTGDRVCGEATDGLSRSRRMRALDPNAGAPPQGGVNAVHVVSVAGWACARLPRAIADILGAGSIITLVSGRKVGPRPPGPAPSGQRQPISRGAEPALDRSANIPGDWIPPPLTPQVPQRYPLASRSQAAMLWS